MKADLKRVGLVLALTVATGVGVAGCAKHHRVTDPTTGSVYYTKQIRHHNGAVKFNDTRTGASVNIQNAEIEKISKHEYKQARRDDDS